MAGWQAGSFVNTTTICQAICERLLLLAAFVVSISIARCRCKSSYNINNNIQNIINISKLNLYILECRHTLQYSTACVHDDDYGDDDDDECEYEYECEQSDLPESTWHRDRCLKGERRCLMPPDGTTLQQWDLITKPIICIGPRLAKRSSIVLYTTAVAVVMAVVVVVFLLLILATGTAEIT